MTVEIVARIANRGVYGKEHVLLRIEGETMEELDAQMTDGLDALAAEWSSVMRGEIE